MVATASFVNITRTAMTHTANVWIVEFTPGLNNNVITICDIENFCFRFCPVNDNVNQT